MILSFLRPLSRLALLAALLVLVGCDTADDDGATDADLTAEAAASIANAVALDTGGALDDAATIATTYGVDAAGPDTPSATAANASADFGCSIDVAFDADAVRYDRSVDCFRENAAGTFSASYRREQTFQFLRDGEPVVLPRNADAVAFELVDGSGSRERPRFSHTLTDIGGALTVEGLDGDLVTINGTQTRAATDVLTTLAGARTLNYSIELAYADLVGPKADRRAWEDNVSGTISGEYQTTFTGIDGDTRSVDVAFTVTFDDGVATIIVDGERFEADAATGELL